MRIKTFVLILVIFIARIYSFFGQNLEYPVQAMIQINAPSPVYLSDYTSGINPALKVSLLLKDLSQTTPVLVTLRFTIEGRGNQQNILLTSKKDLYANLPEISLVAGNYTEIDNLVLASYLNPVNLDISGVNNNDFIQTGGRLPEGAYYFYVEAIVVGRNVKVSNTALSTAMIMLNEPPKWISPWMLPAANTLMKPILPQNIYFSWICQHFSSLATNTEYDFTLAEFLPGTTPEDALDETKANSYRHTFTVQQPFLLYNAGYPMLEIGKKYVCRIKAKDKDNKEVFKNKGYSQILEFTYGQPCPALGLVNATPINAWQTDFKWTKKPEQTTVKLRYREQNPDGSYSEWYTDETGRNQYSLQNLKASKTYQYEAISMCDDLPGEKTEGIFTMPAITEKSENTCGKDVPVEPIDRNAPPLQELKVGDQINAGGFNATITAASGGNGMFSGDCVVDFKPLGIKLKAKFNSISLNNKKQLTAGEINVVEDPDRMIIDVDETAFLFNDLLMDAQIAIDGIPAYLSKLEEMLNQLKDNSQLPQKTHNDLQIIKKKLEEFERKYQDGSLQLTPDQLSKIGELKTAIDQNLQKGILSKKEILADGKTRVYFRQSYDPTKGEIYGFDQKQYDVFEKQYDKLTFSNTDVYYVSYMSLEKNRFTNIKVDMIVEEGKLKPEDIKFRNSMGIELPLVKEGNSNYLLVRDFSTGDEDEIIAYYLEENEKGIKQEKIAGKLKVKIYEETFKQLIVVLVNMDKSHNTLTESGINEIYRQGIAKFNINEIAQISIPEWDNNHTFDNGKSDILSNYTSDMKTVINKYKDTLNASLEDNTLYIFLINYPTSDRKTGYMPRARNCGFIFIQNFKTNNPIYTTAAAHELGHGAFNLTHPFDEFNFPASTTNNLMDYRDSTHLIEYQWGEIHDPESVLLPWFQSDEEGANLFFADPGFIKNVIEKIRRGYITKKPVDFTKDKLPYNGNHADNIELYDGNKYKYIHIAISEHGKIDFRIFVTSKINDNFNITEVVRPKPVAKRLDGFVYKFGFIELTIDGDNHEEILKYIFPDDLTTKLEIQLYKDSTLKPNEINDIREYLIDVEPNAERKKMLYLELQKKIPYHNQRDNKNSAADYMCNLTSEAMCLEGLGKSCPDASMQFEDYLESIRKKYNYGDRDLVGTRDTIAASFNIKHDYFCLSSPENRQYYFKTINPLLEKGYTVMIGMGNHLVRLERLTNEGFIVDDPNGKVDIICRYKNNRDCYGGNISNIKNNGKANQQTKESNIGENDLWKWSEIEKVRISPIEWYFK